MRPRTLEPVADRSSSDRAFLAVQGLAQRGRHHQTTTAPAGTEHGRGRKTTRSNRPSSRRAPFNLPSAFPPRAAADRPPQPPEASPPPVSPVPPRTLLRLVLRTQPRPVPGRPTSLRAGKPGHPPLFTRIPHTSTIRFNRFGEPAQSPGCKKPRTTTAWKKDEPRVPRGLGHWLVVHGVDALSSLRTGFKRAPVCPKLALAPLTGAHMLALLRRRSSQVVRQGSAKALCVGSIPTSASNPDFLGNQRGCGL
jgi:hypothetical protein